MRNRIQSAFAGVHAEAELKERTIEMIYAPAKRRRRANPLIWAAACLVLFLGLGSGLFFIPVSAIGIEINPTLRLKINRFDIVVGVEAINKDGKRITEETNLMFSEYSEAIDTLLADPRMQEYFEQGKDMEIYVECDDEQRCNQMLKRVEGRVGKEGNVTCHAGSGAGHGHSAGKQSGGQHCKHHRHRGGSEE